jgi:hypothetical protein
VNEKWGSVSAIDGILHSGTVGTLPIIQLCHKISLMRRRGCCHTNVSVKMSLCQRTSGWKVHMATSF